MHRGEIPVLEVEILTGQQTSDKPAPDEGRRNAPPAQDRPIRSRLRLPADSDSPLTLRPEVDIPERFSRFTDLYHDLEPVQTVVST